MTSTKKFRPINSLVIVEDAEGGEPPPWVDGKQVLASPSLMYVICYPEQDGPTQLTMGPGEEVKPDYEPVFDGMLETPNRAVRIYTVDEITILREPVSNTETRARVWLNHDRWPDKVVIGLD